MNRSIAFFDTGVEQYAALAQGLPADVERVVLDHRLDGIEQIGRYLRGRANIAALHIICHGSSGALCLGNAVVDANALATQGPWLCEIGNALVPGGDIVLYGCDVAAGAAGLAFAWQLAALTGVNVAAASAAVGAAARGGVAELDVHIGAVSARPLFTQAVFDRLGVRLGETPFIHVPSGVWFALDMFGNAEVDGAISSVTEVDFLRFVQPVIGGVYTIRVAGSGGLDPKIRIYNAAGAALTDQLDKTGANATETETLTLEAGEWVGIAVSGYQDSAGSYKVLVDGPDAPVANIDVGAPDFTWSRSASIGYQANQDWYRVTVPAGTNALTVNLNSTGFDAGLRIGIVQPNGSVELSSVGNSRPNGEDVSNRSVTAGQTIVLSVVGQTFADTGNYTLAVDFNPDDFGDPPSTWTPLSGPVLKLNPFGNVSVSSTISGPLAVTVYAVHIETPGDHVFTVSGALDAQLRLYGADGVALAGGVINRVGAGANETTTFNFTNAGWAYVAVGGSRDNTGAFTLSIDGPNDAVTTFFTPEYSFAGRGRYEIGSLATNSGQGEIDYFSITAPAGTTTLDVNVVPVADLGLAVQLYSASGVLLKDLNGNTLAGQTFDVRGEAITAGSSYYLGVSSSSRVGVGGYTLSADFNPDAPEPPPPPPPPPPVDDFGDPPATTTPLVTALLQLNPFGDVTAVVNIGGPKAVSLYQFRVATAGNHDFSLSGALDSQLRVYGADGVALTGVIDANRGANAGETWTQNFASAGWAYVAVAGYRDGTGAATLSINGPNAATVPIVTPAPNYYAEANGEIGSKANNTGQGEVDFFTLAAPAGTLLMNLTVAPVAGLDTVAQLYTADGTAVRAFNSAPAGQTDVLNAFPITGGSSYFLSVASNSADSAALGTYKITANFTPPASPVPPPVVNFGDPPDSVLTTSGTRLRLNPLGDVSVSEQIDGAQTVRVYIFHVETPGDHVFTVSGALDTQVRIYGDDGAARTGVIDNVRGNGNETVTQNFAIPGWAFVAVAGYRDQVGLVTLNINGPNDAVTPIPTPAPSFAGTARATIGISALGLGFQLQGDTDYFSITAPTGATTLDVRVTPPSSLDSFVQVYSLDGVLLREVNSSPTLGGIDVGAGLAINGGSSYFLGVSNASRTGGGTFDLTVDFNPDTGTVPTPNDDFLTGTAGNDTINALAGNDTINALGGDDSIDGGPGADTINGGPGSDTALYSAARSDYLLSRSNITGKVTVADKFGVMDTLEAVEFLSFAGVRIDAATLAYQPQVTLPPAAEPTTNQVYRFYNSPSKAFFYTPSSAERDFVIAESTNLAVSPSQPLWSHFYQGTTFDQVPAAAGGATIYRFYNRNTDHHFYTSSVAERDYVIRQSTDASFTPNEPLWPFNPELNSGFSAFTSAGAGRDPVFRFYSPTLFRHFYTGSVEEAQEIRLTGVWTDEGIGFYTPS